MKALSDIKDRQKKKDKEKGVTVQRILGGKVPEGVVPKVPQIPKTLQKNLSEEKRKELNKLEDEIEAARVAAEQGAEDIIDTAKKKAGQIIEKASKKQRKAEKIKKEAKETQRATREKARALSKDILQLEEDQKAVRIEMGEQKNDRQEINRISALTKERFEDADQLTRDLAILVSVAGDKITSLSVLEGEVRDEVEHSLNNAKLLYNETEKKEQELSERENALEDRAKELDTQEAALKDARKALKMAQREVK